MEKYLIEDTQSTRCPKCNDKVKILMEDSINSGARPSFYICFPCEYVGQIGVGEVRKNPNL